LSSWDKKRKVITCYNATSDSYNEQYADEQDAKYKVAQKALNTTQHSYSNLLDVGCGSGLFFSHIANKAHTVIGVDVSLSLLTKAKTHAKNLDNVHVVLADADYLPFNPHVFDAVFCFTVLQNMPEPKETLLNFKLQAKTGGKIVVTGLKKAFELTVFLDLFEDAGLRLLEFIDDDNLKCYVAIAATV
jgi:ubiquinone/menaquinone biosynthesis C-methylase UbiE